jgi:hypothetical protein
LYANTIINNFKPYIFILICISFSLVIISNFAEMQLMVFMINIIIISGLIRWQWMLFMLLLGLGVSIVFLQLYLDVTALSKNFTSLEFKVVYLLLLVSSVIIIFLKPKQEQQELTEEKIEHLGERISDREEELARQKADKINAAKDFEKAEEQWSTGTKVGVTVGTTVVGGAVGAGIVYGSMETGALFGSAGGPLGTVIGAGVGLVIGGLISWLA